MEDSVRKFLFVSLFFFLSHSNAANELVGSGGANVDLGSVVVGQSKTDTFTLTNTGTEKVFFYEFFLDFTKGQINFAGVGDFPGDGGTCTGAEIPAGGSCTFTITLKPASVVTLKSNFKINYYYGNKLQKLTMTFHGSGILAPPPPPPPVAAQLQISDSNPFDFGSVAVGAASMSKVFTIANLGELSATNISESGLAVPFVFVGGVFPGTGGTCAAVLAAGASCSVVVDFVPPVAGTYTDTIQLAYFDGYTNQMSLRDVQGTALAPALLKFYGNNPPYDFNIVKVGDAKVHTFMLGNYGDVPATMVIGTGLKEPFRFASGKPFPGGGGTCGEVLMPGKDCQVRVVFAPTKLGKFDGELKITYRNGVSLQGFQQELHGKSSAK